jgi:sec-independent protein translocase protein TatA
MGHWFEILIILGLALLVFGPKRMIEMGSSLGKAFRELRDAAKEMDWSSLTGQNETTTTTPSPPPQTRYKATPPPNPQEAAPSPPPEAHIVEGSLVDTSDAGSGTTTAPETPLDSPAAPSTQSDSSQTDSSETLSSQRAEQTHSNSDASPAPAPEQIKASEPSEATERSS